MKLTTSFVATVLLLSLSTSALPVAHTPHVEDRSLLSGVFGSAGKDAAEDGAAAAGSSTSSSSSSILSDLKNVGSGGLKALFKDVFEGGGGSSSTGVTGAQTNSTKRSIDDLSDLEVRSLLSGILGTAGKDAAEDAGKAAGGGLLSKAKGAIVSGIEGLVGSTVVGDIADKIDPSLDSSATGAQTNSTRRAVDDIEARSLLSGILGTAGKDAAEDAAGTAEKAATGGILSHLKNAAVSGVESVAGSAVIGDLLDHFEGSSSSATGAQTNATKRALDDLTDLEARSLLSGILGTAGKDAAEDAADDAGKAASGGLLSKAKGAIVSGIEGLVGSTVVGDIADKIDPSLDSSATGAQTNSTKRAIDGIEARSLLSGILGTAGKDAAEDAGKAASGGLLSKAKGAIVSGIEGLVGSTVVGDIADKIDPSLDSSATGAQTNATRRAIDDIEARSLLSGILGTAGKDAAEDAAGTAEKAASGGILSHLKNAAVSGVESVAGSAVIGDLLDHFEGSSSSATGAQTNGTARMVRMVRRRE